MSPATVLKTVREKYPELGSLPKAKLKVVENAILYASSLSARDFELISETEHERLMDEIAPKDGTRQGHSLRAYRMREDLTQAELAKKSGIPQGNISAMERGKRPIGIRIAKRLADVLNCRYQKLV